MEHVPSRQLSNLIMFGTIYADIMNARAIQSEYCTGIILNDPKNMIANPIPINNIPVFVHRGHLTN